VRETLGVVFLRLMGLETPTAFRFHQTREFFPSQVLKWWLKLQSRWEIPKLWIRDYFM